MATYFLDTFTGSGTLNSRVSDSGQVWVPVSSFTEGIVAGGVLKKSAYPYITGKTPKVHEPPGTVVLRAELNLAFGSGGPLDVGHVNLGIISPLGGVYMTVTVTAGGTPELSLADSGGPTTIIAAPSVVVGDNVFELTLTPGDTCKMVANGTTIYEGVTKQPVLTLPLGVHYGLARGQYDSYPDNLAAELTELTLYDGAAPDPYQIGWWRNLANCTQEVA